MQCIACIPVFEKGSFILILMFIQMKAYKLVLVEEKAEIRTVRLVIVSSFMDTGQKCKPGIAQSLPEELSSLARH